MASGLSDKEPYVRTVTDDWHNANLNHPYGYGDGYGGFYAMCDRDSDSKSLTAAWRPGFESRRDTGPRPTFGVSRN